MKKFLQKKLNQKGLTLVELLAVIVILGIIAAIAVPSIGNIIENTKYNAVKADAVNALNAANMYFAEDSTATPDSKVTVKELADGGYLEGIGKLEAQKENITITNANPKIITSSAGIVYTGTKTVSFTNATLEKINSDPQKGSTKENKTVPKSQ
ncbi:competence type IV pilus major pilin ComGC [Sporosarcina ureae]|uniref:competence type IV pilus major pilin ComGC n=1 Tax=Sporosarcina ureae TaxID=1571 RepID=UPI0026EF1719|nr:prepilin-type N-terminal cleavage/methylation domain-containing protein [Sporosarcina ureae]